MANAVRRQAARWLVRLQAGDMTARERERFEAWLARDSNHGAEFERLKTAVDAVRGLAPFLAAHDFEAADAPRAHMRLGFAPMAAALAASALLAAGGWWGFAPVEASSSIGQQRSIALTDGSRIELNTDSAVSYRRADMTFGQRRSLVLERGEALFEVAADPDRPFEVKADGALISVVGTTFMLRIHNSEALTLIVSEGVVRISAQSDGAEALVEAGETVELERGMLQHSAVSAAELRRRSAWRHGMLEFDGQPLAAVAAEVSRHTGARFEFADAEIAREPFVAYFRANDLEGFLNALEQSYGLSVERDGERIVLARAESGR